MSRGRRRRDANGQLWLVRPLRPEEGKTKAPRKQHELENSEGQVVEHDKDLWENDTETDGGVEETTEFRARVLFRRRWMRQWAGQLRVRDLIGLAEVCWRWKAVLATDRALWLRVIWRGGVAARDRPAFWAWVTGARGQQPPPWAERSRGQSLFGGSGDADNHMGMEDGDDVAQAASRFRPCSAAEFLSLQRVAEAERAESEEAPWAASIETDLARTYYPGVEGLVGGTELEQGDRAGNRVVEHDSRWEARLSTRLQVPVSKSDVHHLLADSIEDSPDLEDSRAVEARLARLRSLLYVSSQAFHVRYIQGMSHIGRMLLEHCSAGEPESAVGANTLAESGVLSPGHSGATDGSRCPSVATGDLLAFNLLRLLFSERGLGALYSRDLRLVGVVLFQVEELLSRHLPAVQARLRTAGISPAMYATGWIMSIFANYRALPPVAVTRVWDAFLAGGWTEVFRAVLAVVDALAPHIEAIEMDDSAAMERLLAILQHPRRYLPTGALSEPHRRVPALDMSMFVLSSCSFNVLFARAMRR